MDRLTGALAVLGFTIGAGVTWAIGRTWTEAHTSVLLGGGLVVAGIIALGFVVGAWAYGTTHGAGIETAAPGPVVDVRPRYVDPLEEGRMLRNELSRVQLRREIDRERPRELELIPDWVDEVGG